MVGQKGLIDAARKILTQEAPGLPPALDDLTTRAAEALLAGTATEQVDLALEVLHEKMMTRLPEVIEEMKQPARKKRKRTR